MANITRFLVNMSGFIVPILVIVKPWKVIGSAPSAVVSADLGPLEAKVLGEWDLSEAVVWVSQLVVPCRV